MAYQVIAEIKDTEGYLVAKVARMNDYRDYDYVSIRSGDNVITVNVADMPVLMAALLRAANA